MRRAKRAQPRQCSGRLQRGQWDQLCQLPEIMDRGSQEELVSSTKWTSQPEPVKAPDALKVRGQHLDLLPFAPRCHIGLRPDCASLCCRGGRKAEVRQRTGKIGPKHIEYRRVDGADQDQSVVLARSILPLQRVFLHEKVIL